MKSGPHKNWHPVIIWLHWLVALTVMGLFALGWWMVELNYYHAWYKTAPDTHKSIGLILLFFVGIRLIFRMLTASPVAISTHAKWEKWLAKYTHWALYGVLMIVMLSGYLISTADGRAISIFGLFDMPATLTNIKNQEDITGTIHWYGACILIGLTLLHAIGAIKHHFLDKDDTLKRMLGKA
ncbi:cytochrome b [Photobacterium sp. NCIMB 13483]|uniref:Cytochrome b n=1 Tax=Photobacterium piscicola TaxID=1378299 RepID=A0ABU6LGB6_9GAMM|nr:MULTISPECIES: cytochrome b [Photobacterium]MEC6823669.1 cytochrome b [Photobacterium piscicola]MEC6898584.1 cytochrome b [Photobacterium piscicola]PST94301.1 cytochrome b [Photobacterium sp. NCIMB 13483]